MTAYRVRNWSSYNRSLVSRGDLTLWFSEDALKKWHFKGAKSHGNQRYANIAILTACTIKQIFGLSLRASSGFVRSILRILNPSLKSPDYTTICRRSRTLQVPLAGRIAKGPIHVLVDSTGIKLLGEGEWKQYKYGYTRHKRWLKLHLAIDANSLDILAAKVSDSVRLDCNFLPQLLDDIDGPIQQITGDGAYDKSPCYQAAFKRGAKPVFPPQYNAATQRNKTKKSAALLARDAAIFEIGRAENRAERLKAWKKNTDYHRRSLAETTMSRMKNIFGDELKSKSIANQEAELLVRCYALNRMNALGMPISEAEI